MRNKNTLLCVSRQAHAHARADAVVIYSCTHKCIDTYIQKHTHIHPQTDTHTHICTHTLGRTTIEQYFRVCYLAVVRSSWQQLPYRSSNAPNIFRRLTFPALVPPARRTAHRPPTGSPTGSPAGPPARRPAVFLSFLLARPSTRSPARLPASSRANSDKFLHNRTY